MTGILCIYKEKEITSFGVVAKVRGITRERKAGHTGTLDPMATGVLPVLLGGATRFLDFLPDSDKSYRASFLLGKTTDTLDITGRVTGESTVSCSVAEVETALSSFIGENMQLPPMYSAVSVGGQRLYELARRGEVAERTPRKVHMRSLRLVDACPERHTYTIAVTCSKGTYIRTLIDDLGQKLGCGAVMTALERTGAMGLTLANTHTLGELQALRDAGTGFDSVLLPLEKMLAPYGQAVVTDAQARRFANGGGLDLKRVQVQAEDGSLCRVHAPDQSFIGLGRVNLQKGELEIARVYVPR